MAQDAQGNEKRVLAGHLGTHFDVMNQEFPLEYTEREGIVFDVRGILDRDIECSDVNLNKVEEGMLVAFYSGFIDQESYGSKTYFSSHPQLSLSLIDALVRKRISILGVDFAGVRRGKEHPLMDQFCADHGVFVVENLCNLGKLLEAGGTFRASTYPMNYGEMTGLPCRVVARL